MIVGFNFPNVFLYLKKFPHFAIAGKELQNQGIKFVAKNKNFLKNLYTGKLIVKFYKD